MSLIIIGNILNGFGAILCMIAHGQIGIGKNDKKGHFMYVFACIMLSIGSLILESWPVVILNLIWGIIALLTLLNIKIISMGKRKELNILIFSLLIMAGILLILCGKSNEAAYVTVAIYFLSYLQFCGKNIRKIDYLILCSIGFLFLLPHLIEAMQYSVLLSESVNFVIGIMGILFILRRKDISFNE